MSSHPTLLVGGEELSTGEVEVEDGAYRHLFRSLRLAVGDTVRLTDGRGAAWWSRVEGVSPRSARLVVGEPAPAGEPAAAVDLVVAAIRPSRASWLVEKATEVGVRRIRFLHSARSPRNYGRGTLERLRRVAVAALEQSGRSLLPQVDGVHPWSALRELLAPAATRWTLDPEGGAGRLVAEATAAEGGVVVLAGPEGGWSAKETLRLGELGCASVALGPTVLRTETAALVGAALALLPRPPGSVDSP